MRLPPALKRLLLLGGCILLPVAGLTYFGVRSLQDERRGVLEDQRLLASLLRDALDARIEELARRLPYARLRAADLRLYEPYPEVRQAFVIDAEAVLLEPRYIVAVPGPRRAAFDSLMLAAARAEGAAPAAEALELYRLVWQGAVSDAENAEALNALTRLSLAAGQPQTAIDLHAKLALYGTVLDADGAHPPTLSHLRLAGALPVDQAWEMLRAWAEATLDGRYPLSAGTAWALEAARGLEQGRLAAAVGSDELGALLDAVEARLGFARQYARRLQPALAAGGPNAVGVARDGPFAVYTRSLGDGRRAGIEFDLEALEAALRRTRAGENAVGRGYGFSLFEVGAEAEFLRRRSAVPHSVEGASAAMGRLRLGIYALDASTALARHRRQNLMLMSGLCVLAAFAVMGGYLMYRDVARDARLSRLRADFVSNVSHELRTPLTAVRMHLETLLAGRYPDAKRRDRYLRNALRESERLSRLVDNVLAFSQLESGRRRYEFSRQSLAVVVEEVLEGFAPLLEERGFAVEVDAPQGLEDLPLDREAVEIAVHNLVGNAVKYSAERREIKVRVGAAGDGQFVEVADRGIGVDPGERQRIFDRFYRGAGAGRGTAGAGMGLALARGMVEAHGGGASVEGRAGGGSVFRLFLPTEKG